MKPKLPTFSEVQDFLSSIDISRHYSNFGPLVRKLEIAYGEYFGIDSKRIVAFQNATLALAGCVATSNLKTWYVPNYTFTASALAVLQANRQLILVDVDPVSFHIDQNLLTESTSYNDSNFGVIAVMPFGAPVDFHKYSGTKNVLFDAAASIGSPIPDFTSMKEDWDIIYSLHATKVLGCGEGSIVVCGNESKARILRSWMNFGFDGTRDSIVAGTNAKMPEISAAYALASLKNRECEFSEWNQALHSIRSLSQNSSFSTYLTQLPGVRPYWIIDCLEIGKKDQIIEFLRVNGIETRSWWAKPLNEMPAFSNIQFLSNRDIPDISLSGDLAERHLGLPVWRDIPYSTLAYIFEKCHFAFSSVSRD